MIKVSYKKRRSRYRRPGKPHVEGKLNKRILEQRKVDRQIRIGVIVVLLFVTSPLWLYRGIMHEVLLPIYGKPAKAVLVGTMGPSEWSRYRYKKHDYYYAFYKDGKVYEKNSLICVDDSLLFV